MVNVMVQLHTVLQRHTAKGVERHVEVELPLGSTVANLLRLLEIAFPRDSLLVVVNRQLVEDHHELHDGDRVDLMPAISGGAALICPTDFLHEWHYGPQIHTWSFS